MFWGRFRSLLGPNRLAGSKKAGSSSIGVGLSSGGYANLMGSINAHGRAYQGLFLLCLCLQAPLGDGSTGLEDSAALLRLAKLAESESQKRQHMGRFEKMQAGLVGGQDMASCCEQPACGSHLMALRDVATAMCRTDIVPKHQKRRSIGPTVKDPFYYNS